MAHDEALADRIRTILDDRLAFGDAITERKMFGGLAFMVHGHMAIAVSGRGGLMVRADPADVERLVSSSADTEPMEMSGRTMRGWILVASGALADERALADWVDVGMTFAGSMPPKGG